MTTPLSACVNFTSFLPSLIENSKSVVFPPSTRLIIFGLTKRVSVVFFVLITRVLPSIVRCHEVLSFSRSGDNATSLSYHVIFKTSYSPFGIE